MNIFSLYREKVISGLEELSRAGTLPGGLDFARVAVEPPRDLSHGDLSTNAAMVLAKDALMKPRDIAEALSAVLAQEPTIALLEIAGPGFLNIRLNEAVWLELLQDILKLGDAFGDSDLGRGEKVNVEYVSANPTGPLTVGHARGAVVGDALAALLAKVGYDVTKEYYTNDAGSQVDTLARTAHLRYQEALGRDIGEIPAGLYPGDYLIPVGKALAQEYGEKFLDAPEGEWLDAFRAFTITAMMNQVKSDLNLMGIEQDVFSSERHLVEEKAVDRALESLEQKGLIYVGVLEPPKGKKPDDWEPRPQTLFKSTDYGDDVDRPLKKSDGSYTYFANDIAYHYDKYQRGFLHQIDILGADHGGYVKRMKAAVRAISGNEAELQVILCQLVKLLRGGQEVKMSKRSGSFITLRDMVNEVGKDVLRFIMLTRKNDATLEFDFEKVLEQSKDNPVFYVQYAHARCHSVLNHATDTFGSEALSVEALAASELKNLTDSAEIAVIKEMANWPRVLEAAASAYEPHRIAFYLQDLASRFHSLWSKGKEDTRLRFLVDDDRETTLARLAMITALASVLSNGLRLMGVEPRKELR